MSDKCRWKHSVEIPKHILRQKMLNLYTPDELPLILRKVLVVMCGHLSRILRLSTSISHTSAHQCTNLLHTTWCALILTTGGTLWCTLGATSRAQVWCRLAPSVSWDGHTLPWADQLVIQGPIMGLPSHSCLWPLFSKVLDSFPSPRPRLLILFRLIILITLTLLRT